MLQRNFQRRKFMHETLLNFERWHDNLGGFDIESTNVRQICSLLAHFQLSLKRF